jgi:hypothetical protein
VEKTDFLAEYGRLEREFQAQKQPINIGCYQSTDCESCDRCMFCNGCRSCYRCTHCQDCVHCGGCSHCRDCEDCHACSYCVETRASSGGTYLVRCITCADCTYCMGCVGLVKKEFHILNVQYTRTQYFEIVAKLKQELGIR